VYIYIYIYICNPAHRVSRPRGTGSVGDGVGEGRGAKRREHQGAMKREHQGAKRRQELAK